MSKQTESVAHENQPIPATLAEVARHHARNRPEKTALLYEGRCTSFADLDRYASQVGNGLIREGTRGRKQIALLDTNSDHLYEVLFGCAKVNAVFCPVNWRLAAPEVAYIINDSEAEILFVGECFIELVEKVRDKLTTVKKIITLSGKHAVWENYENWRNAQDVADPMCEVAPEDIAIQMYTSGTTGHPKGVQLPNSALLTSAADDSEDMAWDRWTPQDVSMLAMPCFHIGGLRWGLMGLIPGAMNVILTDFDPVRVLTAIPEHKVSKIFLVPAALQFMLRMPQSRDMDYSSLRYIVYGASPIPLPLLEEAMAVFKCDFVQLYGMTETCAQVICLSPRDHMAKDQKRLKAAGKPLPFAEVRIVDANGITVQQGQVGEICVKSPCNMSGYWKLPQETDRTLVDGWIHTGDAGYADEDGFIYIHDRIKDMIISGGENIYPAEVESALFGFPVIADVAVIGVPDEKWGEAVKAIVVLKKGQTASADEIIAYAKERIASYKVPKSIDFVEALPRTATGKLLKKEIRAPYWKGRERMVN
ncbi:MAG: fatty acid--CoA ligase [Zoogloeaceae bacterium]|jgi:Acyl-CoA synthetases (AMP-forming)/AMP-acid ligases II|nr:fatty acid--CoA ligase [Zoogloeaceae bacterium]